MRYSPPYLPPDLVEKKGNKIKEAELSEDDSRVLVVIMVVTARVIETEEDLARIKQEIAFSHARFYLLKRCIAEKEWRT